ncbi:hypothetical protein BFP78_15375 [Gaetbulibacter sp. 5U11]|nr:hypothetical protein BFP78_15375 [Gaetbulibacter sp. 5U11]
MSDTIKEETDSKIAKRGCLLIKDNIDLLKTNIDFILDNQDLLNSEKLHAPIGMISIGHQALETILNEIRNPLE